MAEGLAILNPIVLNGVLNEWTAPESFMGQQMFPREAHPFPAVAYDVIRGSRQVATYNVPNAEAHIVAPMKVGKVTFEFLYTREKKVLEPTTLHWLRTPGTLAQKNAEAAVTREMMDLNLRNERLVEFSIWQALSGELVIDTERLQVTVDMKFGATHKPTAAKGWDQPDADIIGDVLAWKRLIAEDALATATRVYVNSKTIEHIVRNTGVRELMSEGMKARYLTDGVIPNLLGMDWIINDAIYHADDQGTIAYYVPDGVAIFVAPNNSDGSPAFALLDGPSADDDAPPGTTGRFAKTWKEPDPSARQILVERTWFPAIKYPDNVVYAKVFG